MSLAQVKAHVFVLAGLVLSVAHAAGNAPNMDVTPMTVYSDLDNSASKVSFAGAYTRLLITSVLPESSEKDQTMGYPPGKWYHNIVISQQYDINLSAKLKVGEYEETVPLVTLSRTSDKNGDSWLRDLTHDRRNFPWFLVHEGADASVPRVTVEFSGAKTIGSGVAGNALQIALAGIKMVAPEATVVTRLSTNTAKDKAAAIDQILGKLFSNKLNERHTSERDLSKWKPTGGLVVQVGVPYQDAAWDGDLRTIGKWTITFASPRASIFSDWSICGAEDEGYRCKTTLAAAAAEVRKAVDTGAVLAHPLLKTSAGDLSIRDYLLQQSWFSSAEAAMSGSEPLDRWHAEGLCRNTADAMLKLGLNAIDAQLIVKAVIQGIQHSKSIHSTAWSGPTCAAAMN